jgi:hypothetical protein
VNTGFGQVCPLAVEARGYLPFFLVAFHVHDMGSSRRQALVVGVLLAFDAVCLVVFGALLGWI